MYGYDIFHGFILLGQKLPWAWQISLVVLPQPKLEELVVDEVLPALFGNQLLVQQAVAGGLDGARRVNLVPFHEIDRCNPCGFAFLANG